MRRHLHAEDEGYSRAGPIRVVLSDDHAGLRRAVRGLLDREEGIEVVAEASDMTATSRQVRAHHPDVLVLDLSLPDGSSAQRIERLRARAPGTQIVVITMQKNHLVAERALSAGAIGFVLKDSAEVELGDAVRSAAGRVRYESPRLTQAVGA